MEYESRICMNLNVGTGERDFFYTSNDGSRIAKSQLLQDEVEDMEKLLSKIQNRARQWNTLATFPVQDKIDLQGKNWVKNTASIIFK